MFNTGTTGILPTIDLNGNNGNGDNSMWGGSGAWAWIIIIAILFGFGGFGGFGNWGGGFGGGYGGGSTPQFVSTMDTDYIAQGLRDIQSGLATNFLTLNNENLSGVCDIRGDIASNGAAITSAITNGFANQNLQNLQNSNSLMAQLNANNVASMQNVYGLQATLAQMASDSRADAAQNAYNQATNTCAIQTSQSNGVRDIVQAVNDGNRAILEAMAQNKVEAMQDRINDLQGQLQRQTYLADNAAQTNAIVNQLEPKAPIPAFTVPNPFTGCNCRYGTMNYANA